VFVALAVEFGYRVLGEVSEAATLQAYHRDASPVALDRDTNPRPGVAAPVLEAVDVFPPQAMGAQAVANEHAVLVSDDPLYREPHSEVPAYDRNGASEYHDRDRPRDTFPLGRGINHHYRERDADPGHA
jgi:hypothetical protein